MDLQSLGIKEVNSGACIGGEGWMDCSTGKSITSFNPSTGKEISQIQLASSSEYNKVMQSSIDAFKTWRTNLRNIPQDNTTESKYDELLERKDDGSLKHSIWEKP